MPDDPPRRIIIEKSSTVRRRYQRSDRRFKFTPAQLARIEREQKREARAKEIRERDKKRTVKKKQKAEKEAREREERKRLGLPDPNAPKVPSSQPLLSNFLCRKPSAEETLKEESPTTIRPDPTTIETDEHGRGEDTEAASAAGDTEVDSDAFDDLDEELENEISNLEDAGVVRDSGTPDFGNDTSKETVCPASDDDEFSDCSVFDDEYILKKAEAIAPLQSTTTNTDMKDPSISNPSVLLPVPSNNQPKGVPTPIASIGDSFRDETADCLEAMWEAGASFSELLG